MKNGINAKNRFQIKNKKAMFLVAIILSAINPTLNKQENINIMMISKRLFCFNC